MITPAYHQPCLSRVRSSLRSCVVVDGLAMLSVYLWTKSAKILTSGVQMRTAFLVGDYGERLPEREFALWCAQNQATVLWLVNRLARSQRRLGRR